MAVYTYATLTQAQAALAARLYDSTNQFWTLDELTLYLTESLRTFNALSNFWKSEFVFSTVANQWWYDLTAQTGSLRAFTVTDVDLFTIMEYHLLEPPTGATWTGTLQFGIQDLLQAVQRRQDEVLSISGCTVTRSTTPATPQRTVLADNVIDIRRVAWLPTGSPVGYSAVPLWAGDQFEAQGYEPGYAQNPGGTPTIYMRSADPPLSFDTDNPPAVPGDYDLLTVNAGATLSTSAPTALKVPDDWSWVVKWGALADCLNRESNAKDQLRAKYCEERYKQAVMMLKDSACVLVARIGNVAVQVDSVQASDDYDPTWQAAIAGPPVGLLTAGLNLVALSPKPDAGPYSVSVSVVQNAPITQTVSGTAYLQVSRDNYDAVIDYAQHLAAFKMGGAEFMATLPLFDRLLKQAALYNSKLTEYGMFTDIMLETSQLQEQQSPRLSPGESE